MHGLFFAVEGQRAVLHPDVNRPSLVQRTEQNLVGQRFFDVFLDHPRHRTGTHLITIRRAISDTSSGIATARQEAGSDRDVDGVFFVNSRVKPRDIRDGLSNTMAISETVLGPGDRDELLSAVMPEQIARFFLFDGDMAPSIGRA